MNRIGTQFGEASGFTFRDEPVYYPEERYDAAREAYTQRISELPGVVSVYQMGGVSAPGISDLDLIAVLDGMTTPAEAPAYGTGMMPAGDRYIFFHPGAMVTRQDIFPRLALLTYAANLTHRWGEAFEIQPLEHPRWVECANLIDQSTHLLHALTKSAVSKIIYTRRMIMALSSIGHTIALARNIGLPIDPAWECQRDEVQALKTGWFEDRDRDRLVKYADRARPIVLEVLSRLAGKMLGEGLLPDTPADAQPVSFFPGINAFTRFADCPVEKACWGVRGLSVKIGQSYMSTTLSVVTLPSIFAAHVAPYAAGRTPLSAQLAKSLGNGQAPAKLSDGIDSEYGAMLRDRVDLWGENLGYLASYGLMAYDVMPFFGARLAFAGGGGLKGKLNRLRDCAVMRYNRRAYAKATADGGRDA